MTQSLVLEQGKVSFPWWKGDSIYMESFLKKEGLPFKYKRYQRTVDMMLDGVETDQPIYLMVDEKFVGEGELHRRGGVHMDGYWNAGVWDDQPYWRNSPMSMHGHRHITSVDAPKEAVILASNHYGCRGFKGHFSGEPQVGGDCSHLSLNGLEEVPFLPGKVWAGNAAMLHESIPAEYSQWRTVVRLNVPGWSPNA